MPLKITVAFYLAALVTGVFCLNAQEQPSGDAQNSAGPAPVFRPGHGVTEPRPIYVPVPEFSEQALTAPYQGTCTLSIVVGEDGKPRNVKVMNPIGMGLDEKAIEAVSNWRFEPGTKDGKPVAVQLMVEVDFHLYGNNDRRIADLMKQAAKGDAKAELELSTVYFKVQDSGRNDPVGLMYLERAAKHGSPRAQFLMGEHIAHESAPAYPKAYMWYALAQRSGYKHSDKALKQLSAKMTQEQIQAGQTLVDNWPIASTK
jgi:TonB family protein